MRKAPALKGSPHPFHPWLLAPALAMLALLFVGPIAAFLWSAFASGAADARPLARALEVLRSAAALTALVDTTLIAGAVTLLTLLVGYPLAYALTRAKGLAFVALISAVTLPHFTSVIVRTYAWMVVLGRHGIVNEALTGAGLAAHPLDLLYNRIGVVIGMTYVLLPYMVLTLYAAMRALDPGLMRAARGMGAGALQAFARVFLPLTAPGVAAGALIVFILGLGFFVTPALMGGPHDTVTAMMIERQIELEPDWPAAAALSLSLLAPTLLLYGLYVRFADPQRMLG